MRTVQKSKPNVSIVVVNFHGEKDTLECLQSLRNLTAETYNAHIILVDVDQEKKDSGNSPFTPYAETILYTKNKGFSGNYNVGIQYAFEQLSCDYVMILNNDTIVEKDLVQSLLSFARTKQPLSIFSPKIYFAPGYEFHKSAYTKDERGKVIWYAGGYIDWQNVYAWHKGVDEIDLGQHDKPIQTAFSTGCCMLIPRDVYQKMGLLDDRYFLYWEDTDYSLRVKKQGGEIWYVPSTVMWHKNAGSTGGSGSETHMYYQTRNRILFGMRYAPVRTKIALLREACTMMFKGSSVQKEATKDAFLGHFGKQRS